MPRMRCSPMMVSGTARTPISHTSREFVVLLDVSLFKFDALIGQEAFYLFAVRAVI